MQSKNETYYTNGKCHHVFRTAKELLQHKCQSSVNSHPVLPVAATATATAAKQVHNVQAARTVASSSHRIKSHPLIPVGGTAAKLVHNAQSASTVASSSHRINSHPVIPVGATAAKLVHNAQSASTVASSSHRINSHPVIPVGATAAKLVHNAQSASTVASSSHRLNYTHPVAPVQATGSKADNPTQTTPAAREVVSIRHGINYTHPVAPVQATGSKADNPTQTTPAAREVVSISHYVDSSYSVHSAVSNEAASLPMGTSHKKDIPFSGLKERWTHETTLLLIETYREKKHLFANSALRQSEVWKQITMQMNSHGYHFDTLVVDQKFRSLKSRYKTLKDLHGKSGREKVQWLLYTAMDDLLRKDPAITPTKLVSSLPAQDEEEVQIEKTTTPSETPSKKRKLDQPPPKWFSDYLVSHGQQFDQLHEAQQQMIAIQQNRNNLLEKLTDALSK